MKEHSGRLLAGLFAGALFLGACGSSDDDTDDPATTTTVAAESDSTTTVADPGDDEPTATDPGDDESSDADPGDDETAEAGSSATSGSVGGSDATEFCDALEANQAIADAIDPAAMANDPEALEAFMRDGINRLDDAMAIAPEEIRSDLGVIRDYQQQLLDLSAANDFDLARIEADPSFLSIIISPDFDAASGVLSDFEAANC